MKKRMQRKGLARLYCLVGLVSLAASFAHAQATAPASVTLPTSWPVGTRYKLEIVRERIREVEGQPPQSNKHRYTVDVEVREQNDKGYVLVWKLGPDAVDIALPFDLNKVLPSRMELVIQTDAMGTPTSLVNLQEHVDLFRTAMKAMQEGFRKEGKGFPELENFFQQMTNPQFVQALSLREPGIYCLACGSSLVVGNRVEYDDLLPNPLGNEPLPSKGYFLLLSANAGLHEATIEWGQQLNSEKTREFINKIVRSLLPNASAEEFDRQVGKMQLTINDKATYVFDTRSGLPKNVEYSRAIRVSEQGRTDRWSMKLLPSTQP